MADIAIFSLGLASVFLHPSLRREMKKGKQLAEKKPRWASNHARQVVTYHPKRPRCSQPPQWRSWLPRSGSPRRIRLHSRPLHSLRWARIRCRQVRRSSCRRRRRRHRRRHHHRPCLVARERERGMSLRRSDIVDRRRWWWRWWLDAEVVFVP